MSRFTWNLFASNLLLSLLLHASPVSATNIDIGTVYQANGSPGFFDNDGKYSRDPLLDGSTFQFAENGIFYLDLVTNEGSAHIELGFDLDEFNLGGDVRLRPAIEQDVQAIINQLNASGAGPNDDALELDTNMDGNITPIDALILINDLNSGETSDTLKQVGMFSTFDDSFYSFIAVAMDGVFHLDRPSQFFSIWNKQFAADGAFLGQIDFHLTVGDAIPAGEQVPEPATMLLLGAGLLAGMKRRKLA